MCSQHSAVLFCICFRAPSNQLLATASRAIVVCNKLLKGEGVVAAFRYKSLDVEAVLSIFHFTRLKSHFLLISFFFLSLRQFQGSWFLPVRRKWTNPGARHPSESLVPYQTQQTIVPKVNIDRLATAVVQVTESSNRLDSSNNFSSAI